MSTYNVSSMYSTVKNTSGVAKTFSFLPPHGKPLAANEEYTVFGNIYEAVQSAVDRVSSTRNIAAFIAAVKRGELDIMQTPNPVLRDGLGNALQVRVDRAHNLSVSPPTWDSVAA